MVIEFLFVFPFCAADEDPLVRISSSSFVGLRVLSSVPAPTTISYQFLPNPVFHLASRVEHSYFCDQSCLDSPDTVAEKETKGLKLMSVLGAQFVARRGRSGLSLRIISSTGNPSI